MPGLELMAVSEAAGVFAVKEKSGSQFFVMGHPEYDADTLAKEYFRDGGGEGDPCAGTLFPA